MSKRNGIALILGSMLASSGISTCAFAADEQQGDFSPSSAEAGDIIVTARRVEERLQDVPISITVFNQEQLSSRNVVTGADLATYTPSLSANNNFGSANTSFSLRGFHQEYGTAPSVGIYFADVVAPRAAANNVPMGDGAGPGNFFDLQNVQVLKGAQGTLFGRNTTGGAILLVPQKPTQQLEGYVEGSLGNYNMHRLQGVINVPVGETVRLRLGADWQHRDGYLRNTTGIGPGDFGDINYVALRGSLVVDLTPDLENYTIVSYLHSKTNGDVQKLVACDPGNLFAPYAGFACAQLAREQGADFFTAQSVMRDPEINLTQFQAINTTTWKASDTLTVKNILSYATYRQSFRGPLFGTDFRIINNDPSTSFWFATQNPAPGKATSHQYTFTEEFQLQGNASDNRLIWQAGAYLEISRPLSDFNGNFTPNNSYCTDAENLNCVSPLGFGIMNYTVNNTYFRNVGLYAQGTYSLTDQLKLTAGFRYTWDETRTDAILSKFALNTRPPTAPLVCNITGAPFPSCDVHYLQKSSAPTWLIGLDFKPNEDVLLYAKYSRGYRAGGVSPQANPPSLATFQPERVDTYELGAKVSFDGPVRGYVNVAGFYNDFRNQQLTLNLIRLADLDFASSILNAEKTRIYGAEIEASISPFQGFTLDASYAYLNTRVLKVTVPTIPGLATSTDITDGDELPNSPNHKFVLTGTYVLPLDPGLGKLSLSATWVYTGERLTNYLYKAAAPAFRGLSFQRATNLLNLNATWKGVGGSPFDLSIFATNVTNVKYYNHVPGLINGLGFETAVVGEPRMVGGRVRFNF